MRISTRTKHPVEVTPQVIAYFEQVFHNELDQLVDHLDNFLEMRIKAEFDELRAEIARLGESAQTAEEAAREFTECLADVADLATGSSEAGTARMEEFAAALQSAIRQRRSRERLAEIGLPGGRYDGG